ncbi:putative polyketide synthase [Stachybotrys elegans]|uniref:Polyketide synthase n=1 Tax=Stachybotrys elegans TaxID=80388 RepID=A0A8K0S9I4_9HYPO|nr:putative polyketide synthase [Stachybotrys elegans]
MESTSSGVHTSNSSNSHEMDGEETDPIVICGFAIKFPEDTSCPENLWQILTEKRCLVSEFPESRFNIDGFYDARNSSNSIPLRGGYFINDDISAFDADFFSIPPVEAASLDPMQRWLLETTYHALEASGIPMETAAGSATGVFTGCFSNDYLIQLHRDAECLPTYAATGTGLSMLANRLSWFFDFRGPSIGLDSACSSGAMGIDIACQSLRSKSCDMAVVAGGNLTFSPEMYKMMTNMRFLSPDSRCYSFDHRANGYARGEGICVVILKRLSSAMQQGNVIRAVIRSTRSNEDGRTQGITQPNPSAQESLIHQTYKAAGLSMHHTRYFEAHGTGTALGDPIEAQAIGSAFKRHRSGSDPLFVGALKSNIGHLEGASALASLVKTVLVLERGIIPPNANFERISPMIDASTLNLKFPQQSYPWPIPGLRRAPINSFGYGGANSHIVLDDAYNYMRLRSLSGRHCTVAVPGGDDIPSFQTWPKLLTVMPKEASTGDPGHRLLVLSSADDNGIKRLAAHMAAYVARHPTSDGSFLDDLVYTLGRHRSNLLWRAYAVVANPSQILDLPSHMSKPIQRPSSIPWLGYVFTGQGAQWHAMGRELLCYERFRQSILSAETYLATLGWSWSFREQMLKSEESPLLNDASYSQTTSTVLQIALVDLLRSLNVQPSSVVGHSSGEIAAAYAAGFISAESACKLAYYRGLCTAELAKSASPPHDGAMISVGLPENEVGDLLRDIRRHSTSFGITIACVNSPTNVTVSGERHLIERLKTVLDSLDVFSRNLRVPVAYHSAQMNKVSDKYIRMVGQLSRPVPPVNQIPMISSVNSSQVSAEQVLDPEYWALNLVSTVHFRSAVETMCTHQSRNADVSRTGCLVEIGPHAALAGPIREILSRIPGSNGSIEYHSVLKRDQSATATMLATLGALRCMDITVDLAVANQPSPSTATPRSMLVNLPPYPFDRSQKHWYESRLSRSYRTRRNPPSEILGVPSNDWNPTAGARWRHFLKASEIDWIKHHVINDSTLFPAGGMIAMAVEAALQLTGEDHPIEAFILRDVTFEKPIDLTSPSSIQLEVQTTLHPVPNTDQETSSTHHFMIQTYDKIKDEWLLNCQGVITVDKLQEIEEWTREAAKLHLPNGMEPFRTTQPTWRHIDHGDMYESLKKYGYHYGPSFQRARVQRFSGRLAAAEVASHDVSRYTLHPAILDTLFHLSFTALTQGGSLAMSTCIPTRLDCIIVDPRGPSSTNQPTLQAFTSISSVAQRGFSCEGVLMSPDTPEKTMVWFKGLTLANISSNSGVTLPSRTSPLFCMEISTKVALSKMTNEKISKMLKEMHPDEETLKPLFENLEMLVKLSLDQVIRNVDSNVCQEPWMQSYWNWVRHHRKEPVDILVSDGNTDDVASRIPGKSLREIVKQVSLVNHTGRLYALVAENLEGMLRGEVKPSEMLFGSDALSNYYEELDDYACSRRLSAYVDLLAHEKPGMNILEVGGGTGAGTRRILDAIRMNPYDPSALLRCNRYDFTDISTSFLSKARQEFNAFHSQMAFRKLDIEQSLAKQGFQDAEYDVVLAVSVLHIASDLAKALTSIRKSLKPGGKLIAQEFFSDNGWIIGYIFGLFPGWWQGTPHGRPLSPNITVEAWDRLLRGCGFSGIDLNFVYGEDTCYHHGWLVTTAVEQAAPIVPQPQMSRVVIVTNTGESCQQQQLLANALLQKIQSSFAIRIAVQTLDEGYRGKQPIVDSLVVLLTNYGQLLLERLREEDLRMIKSLVGGSRHLLWVSSGEPDQDRPDGGMLEGLTRTLRSEDTDLHLVTLSLDKAQCPHSHITHIIQVMCEMMSTLAQQPYEEAYVEIDSVLHTRRLLASSRVQSAMGERLKKNRMISATIGADNDVQFTLSISPSGQPQYQQAFILPRMSHHAEDSIDVRVAAFSLDHRDSIAASGYQEHPTFGTYASGTVLSSSTSTCFTPGTAVFVACRPAASSHLRVKPHNVVELPDGLSFTNACWFLPPMIAAYHCLVEVARVQSSDTVLIHGGGSLAGQAALQLLLQNGFNQVWTTVSDEKEKWDLTHRFGIAPNCIVPRQLLGRMSVIGASELFPKFDKVFSVDNEHIRSDSTLIQHLRPGGHYVGLQPRDQALFDAHNLTSRQATTVNISMSFVDMALVQHTHQSLEYAAHNVNAALRPVPSQVLSSLPASQISDVFIGLKKGNMNDPVVVELADSNRIQVQVENRPDYVLHSDATYVIAGGLGGLGQHMARWLVSRGARYLILLSRSGATKPSDYALKREFAGQGVQIETPACDIGQQQSLRSVIESLSKRLPPIRGCIQASMVMEESIFEKMTLESWQAVSNPKVRGSWNLHTVLPRKMDFFILFSSAIGILGSPSLGAYSAGNTFQDSLAHYRVLHGEHAISLDIGGVSDDGFIARSKEQRNSFFKRNPHLTPMTIADVLALLDMYCCPSHMATQSQPHQAIVGISPPGLVNRDGASFVMSQPFWGHIRHIPWSHNEDAGDPEGKPNDSEASAVHQLKRLLAAGMDKDATQFAVAVLTSRIAGLLGMETSHIDQHRPINQLGVDSLVGIELRNWISATFDIKIPVLEISSGISAAELGSNIVSMAMGKGILTAVDSTQNP